MSFVQRLIEITITLAAGSSVTGQASSFSGGSFLGSTANTITLSNHRASLRVQNNGAPAGSTAQVTIYGMNLDLINQIATLGMRYKLVPKNSILVKAGDATSGLGIIFGGTIIQAYADFNNVPEVPFHIEAQSGYAETVIPVPATSISGPVDVATALKSLANLAGWGFNNNGVNGPVSIKLPTTYTYGSILDQVKTICDHSNVAFTLAPTGTTLSIWPKGSAQKGPVPTISPPPNGQMISYPTYTAEGIILRTLYDPNLGFGGQVVVQGSSLTRVNGTWNIGRVDQVLDSQLPGGKWETVVYAYDPRFPLPALTPVQ